MTKKELLQKVQDVISANEKIMFPFHKDYLKQTWDIVKSLTEIIQNCIDSKKVVSIDMVGDGIAGIIDKGRGMEKKHILIGCSEKSAEDIGQFGEGLKLALLVYAKKKKLIIVETKGFSIVPRFEYNPDLQEEVLYFYLKDTDKPSGTAVYAECEKEELEKAKSFFLVLQNKKKYTDSIYEGDGKIYVNGFFIAQRNSRFDYNLNLKDKVNRDRTVLDEMALENSIAEIIKKLDNKEVIRLLLENPTDYPQEALERRLGLTAPYFSQLKHLHLWKEVAEEIFPKTCMSSGTAMDDFGAEKIGYSVLREIDTPFPGILTQILPNARIVMEKYADKVVEEDTMYFPFLRWYMPNGTLIDAIVEFTTNAYDTGTPFTLEYENGKVIIEDQGPGLKKENLVFGKHVGDRNKIGFWGEGLKLAILIATRDEADLLIESTNFNLKASFEYSEKYGSASVLALHLLPPTRSKGTRISLLASEAQFKEAKRRISYLLERDKLKPIWREPNVRKQGFYVQGIFVEEIDTLFSYNTNDKSLLATRDRNYVDYWVKADIIKEALENLEDEKLIRFYLGFKKSNINKFEYQIEFTPKNADLWNKIVKEMYPNYCIPSNVTFHNVMAEDQGYVLLNNLPHGAKKTMCNFLPKAEKIAFQQHTKVGPIIPFSEFTSDEKEMWSKAFKLIYRIYNIDIDESVFITSEFKQINGKEGTLGLYEEDANGQRRYYILREAMKDPETFIGTLIHEIEHGISGAPDNTREFENALTKRLGQFGYMLTEVFF